MLSPFNLYLKLRGNRSQDMLLRHYTDKFEEEYRRQGWPNAPSMDELRLAIRYNETLQQLFNELKDYVKRSHFAA